MKLTAMALLLISTSTVLSTADISNRHKSKVENLRIENYLNKGKEIYTRVNSLLTLQREANKECIASAIQSLINQKLEWIGTKGQVEDKSLQMDQETKEKLDQIEKKIEHFSSLFDEKNPNPYYLEDEQYFYAQLSILRMQKEKILDQFKFGKKGLSDSDVQNFQNKVVSIRQECKEKTSLAFQKDLDTEEMMVENFLKELRTASVNLAFPDGHDQKDLAEITMGAISVLVQLQESRAQSKDEKAVQF